MKNLKGARAAGVIALAFFAGSSLPAQAAYMASLEEIGANVIGTGSGSLNVTGLTSIGSQGVEHAYVTGLYAVIVLGTASPSPIAGYTGISGPTSFGSNGNNVFADSGTGDLAGVVGVSGDLLVPLGYASGTSLGTSTDTWDSNTFASLGVTPGTYVWTWGSGADADSFTLQIGPAAVAEPGSLALLGAAIVGFGLIRRRRAKATRLAAGAA